MATNELSPMYRCTDGNVVQFYEMAVPNDARTIQEGRPVIWKALMAKIMSPGMKNQIHHQELELRDEGGKVVRRKLSNTTREKKRVHWDEIFAPQIKAWRENEKGTEALGTPLENYPKIDVAVAAMLRAQGVYSLEQLGAVPDAQLDGLGPQSRALRDGAVQFLGAMTGNTALKAQVEELKAQMAKMLEAQNAPAKRGRKPKVHAQAEAA